MQPLYIEHCNPCISGFAMGLLQLQYNVLVALWVSLNAQAYCSKQDSTDLLFLYHQVQLAATCFANIVLPGSRVDSATALNVG